MVPMREEYNTYLLFGSGGWMLSPILNEPDSCLHGVWGESKHTWGISKQAIARHLNVENVFQPIPPGLRKNPLNTLSAASQPLNRFPVCSKHHCLRVTVPVELNPIRIVHALRYLDGDSEPVCGPRGTEGLPDISGLKGPCSNH